jgi:hypothetical protein
VAASASYPDLLALAGLSEIDEVDLTNQYPETASGGGLLGTDYCAGERAVWIKTTFAASTNSPSSDPG